ncbi:MAG: hypothetical protein NUW22_08285 [Acidobacteria bacterium]|nr:hypothetical protein [Acidobacteriota bacterium]
MTTTDLTADDTLIVELYDRLDTTERAEWRAMLDPIYYADYPAVLAELDRIDAGLKPLCLS